MSNSDGKSFSAEDLDRFFNESFEKEGLRIKRSSAVFDFMADKSKKMIVPISFWMFLLPWQRETQSQFFLKTSEPC